MSISIEQELRLRRRDNEIKLAERKKEVFQKLPRVKEIEEDIRRLNLKRIDQAISGKPYEDTVKEIEKLRFEKTKLLESSGYKDSYLELQYHCPICKDTGIHDRKACICRKKLLAKKLYDQSMIEDRIKKENFKNFNPNVFRKSRMQGEDISPYENILQIKDDMLYLLDRSDKKLPNLYFYGKVGTGKTFMINCIAKELMDKGVPVLYQSSNDMLNFLSSYQFMYPEDKKLNKAKVDLIYDVDVLIIDDLGTEMITDVTKSNLFEVINKRMISEKTTIISSNIMLIDLSMNYDQRISSRIIGEYTPVEFYGNDIRINRL